MCFAFLCFQSVNFLIKMAPKCSIKMLVSVPEHEKAVIYLMEKICVRYTLFRLEL